MFVADTSAWVDFLRGARSWQSERLRAGLIGREIIVVEPVLMEVMSGARVDGVGETLRLMDSQRYAPMAPRLDFLDAATVYRELRSRGLTVRSQIDTLIAATAIRLGLPVLHRDRDYDVIAEHTSLALVVRLPDGL